LQDL